MKQVLKRIGKGSFTTAYLMDNDKVLLKSSDPIKECMAMGWFPNSHLFPKVKFGDVDNEYIMNYYPKQTSLKNTLKPKHYAFYKELRRLWEDLPFNYDVYTLRTHFRYLTDKRKSAILIEALEACMNYGSDICFEISPRNVAVGKTGNLILLDCFYIKSLL